MHWLKHSITWRLWNALYDPLRKHPLFARGQQKMLPRTNGFPQLRWLLLGAGVVVVVLAAFLVFLLVALLLVLLVLLALLSGAALGGYWAMQSSERLAAERDNFPLWESTPRGAVGVSWLLATGIVHRSGALHELRHVLRWLLRVALALVGIVVLLVVFASGGRQTTFLLDMIALAMLLVALWLDYVQSAVFGTVYGLSTALLLPNSLERFLAVRFGYPALQASVYLATFGWYELNRLFFTEYLRSVVLAHALTAACTLLVFFALREALLRGLLFLLLRTYRLSPQEFFGSIEG